MKKIFVSALVCAIAIACSVGVQAACPAHGSKSITTTCAGYPAMFRIFCKCPVP